MSTCTVARAEALDAAGRQVRARASERARLAHGDPPHAERRRRVEEDDRVRRGPASLSENQDDGGGHDDAGEGPLPDLADAKEHGDY